MRILVLCFLLSSMPCHAQDLLLFGKVRQYEAKVPLSNASIHVSRNGKPVVTVKCDSAGDYRIALDVGQLYVLDYRSPGRISKNILVDLRTTPAYDGGYSMPVDVRLFEPREGVDVSFLQEPIGKASYDSTVQNITWDMHYTAPRMERVNKAFPVRYTIEEEPAPSDSVGVDGE